MECECTDVRGRFCVSCSKAATSANLCFLVDCEAV